MFRIPLIRTVPKTEEGSTWLQLFFDLIYVAILVEMGDQLSSDLTLEGLSYFIILFIPVWWSWFEFVDYGRRYPVDDIGHRVLTVIYMGVMLLMAFEIHALNEVGIRTFILTFGLSKFVLALMYGRSWIYYPTYRRSTGDRAAAYFLVGIMWIIVAYLTPANLWAWLVPITLGALIPHLIRLLHGHKNQTDLRRPPIKHHFTLHRFGELTIIVLGEFFIKLVVSSAGRELAIVSYVIGIGLLAISISLWWLYFDHLEHAGLSRAGSRLWFWIYSHFPFMVGITAYGVVGTKIFAVMPRQPVPAAQRILFTFALAAALLAYAIIEWASREKEEPLSRPHQPWVRLVGAVVLLAIGMLGGFLNAGMLVGVVAAVLLIQVILDVISRLQRPNPDFKDNALQIQH